MKQFVGIGFGPIQSGLFVYEAYRSGNFSQLTVAEVDHSVVRAVQDNKGARIPLDLLPESSLHNLWPPQVWENKEAYIVGTLIEQRERQEFALTDNSAYQCSSR